MKSPPAAFCGFSRPCAQAAMTSGAVLVATRRKKMQGGKEEGLALVPDKGVGGHAL